MFHKLILILVIYANAVCTLEEGDECTIKDAAKSGTCRLILNCPKALELIQKGVFPQTCKFQGTVPIVCCENNDVTTTSTTTTEGPKEVTDSPKKELIYDNPYRPNTPGHKSFEQCVQYSKLVKEYKKPPTLIIDASEEEFNTCGFTVVQLIIGGEIADRTEFPHMALVGFNSPDGIEWSCGGTLISENYVLTAGHCLISRDFGNATQVRMGIINRNDPSKRQDIKIAEIIAYPSYEPPSHYHDIGLLKLEKPPKFNRYVRPACLHYTATKLNERAVASGWGNTEFTGASSDDLLKVTLELTDATSCNNSFKKVSQLKLKRGIDYETQVCAGSPGKDTCQGDSGGPLQIYSKIKCMYEIIGVTSFGKACGIGKSPGVYTRVSHYISWLEEKIWGN